MGQFSKPWNELTIADNFIFCKVMENERICRGVLETLLGISVEHIDYLKTENPIENFAAGDDCYMGASDKTINKNVSYKSNGLSVRCVMDYSDVNE